MSDLSDDQRIANMLLRWEDSVEAGDEVTAEELCADAPELCDRLVAKIDALRKMSWMTASNEPTTLPEVISGRYVVERLLGVGGHGLVYLCHDDELDRHVAVKVSASKFLPSLADEAKRLAKLRHDHIVSIFDVATHEGSVAIVSEFIDGHSLAERLQSGPISTNEAVTITSTVADALHHAHTNGFVHRDVKPSNILIDQAGKAYLADFGIAQDSNSDGEAVNLGTLAYSSPEQVADRRRMIGPATDVYSLGVVFYECLTGQLPYETKNADTLRDSILLKQIPGPSFVNPDVPDWLNAVCMRCLAKHPEERFKSADELATALRTPPREPLTLPRWVQSVALVAATAVIAATVGYWLHPNEVEPKFPVDVRVPGNADSNYFDTIYFDGKTRIITPVERFAPCTLEAWVRPERLDAHCHFVIGSDIPTEKGIGMAICTHAFTSEQIAEEITVKSPRSVLVRKWSHLAVVFAEEETRLYWNGWLVETAPPTKSVGGTNFVIGNVGEQHDIDYFVGWMRAIRISKGERFTEEKFLPENEFISDDEGFHAPAILLYDETSAKGETLIDRSGRNNHGVVEIRGE